MTTVRVNPPMLTTATAPTAATADEPRVVGPQVCAGGERDRDARGGLADDEPPPGEVTPERPELTAGVHVRASGLRVHGGQLGRGGGVAERDGCRDHETDEEAGSGRVRGRAPGAEHAGADHRTGADVTASTRPSRRLQRRRHSTPRILGCSATGGLEELDDVAGRVLEQDLLAAGSFHDVVAERRAGVAEPSDLGVDVVDDEVDPVPTSRAGLSRRPASDGLPSSSARRAAAGGCRA